MAQRRDHFDQLPRFQPWTIERLVALIGGVAGIVALFVTFFKLDHLSDDLQTKIFVFELSAFSFGCILYLYATNRKKLHRFAQAVFYVHFINHAVRYEIAGMEAAKRPELRELMQDIVDAASNCFSLLVGRRCRCCIVEIDADQNVTTVVRDRLTRSEQRAAKVERHRIADNTDFSSLWYGRNGCPRYFLSRNLVSLWRKGKYQNSSFALNGPPEVISAPGLPFINFVRWPLPYKSTIVWPIRYIPEKCKWPAMDESNLAAMPAEERPFVWGFLCVDCRSQNTFDTLYAPELGAAMADALFSLFHAARMNARLPAVDNNQGTFPIGALPSPESGVKSPGTNRPTAG